MRSAKECDTKLFNPQNRELADRAARIGGSPTVVLRSSDKDCGAQ